MTEIHEIEQNKFINVIYLTFQNGRVVSNANDQIKTHTDLSLLVFTAIGWYILEDVLLFLFTVFVKKAITALVATWT